MCLYKHPPIAQLVERRTVDATLAGILRSLVQIRLGGQHFSLYIFCFETMKIYFH